MRILLLNYEFPPIGGGGGKVSYYLGRAFASAGHEVRLITSRFRDLPAHENVEGIQVWRVPVVRRKPDVCGVHEMMTYVLSATEAARRLWRTWTPDIMQVFFGIPSGPVGYAMHLLHGTPYVVFLGGRDVPRRHPDPPSYRLWYGVLAPAIRSIWGHAAAVVACSGGLRQLALKTAPWAEVQVIPDGADLSRFRPVPREPEPAVLRLLTIGRLIPRKGMHLLIQALPRVTSKRPFQVEIVGDGPERAALERLTHQAGVADRVHFVGSVPYERLVEHYQRADGFVLCSYAEGMPLVVLEAMACGLPIVASRVQGIEELVHPGENGYLFPPGDVSALARCLDQLLEAGAHRLEMGRLSVQRVQPYDWNAIATRYLKLYDRVLSFPRPHGLIDP